MKQHESVIQVVELLGGVATLAQLYHEVPKVPKCDWKTKTPQASIRRIVQLQKEIFKIKPGLYGLLSMKKELESRGIIQETESNKNSKQLQQSNHTYYQGLLLLIGKYRQFDCWAPNQDRNKAFLTQNLDALRNIDKLPPFAYPNLVKRSETIDVIWFNQRGMPNSFFEVEFSTDIQNSLLKFNDLQDFYVQMVIVAERWRREEFRKKVAYSAFEDLQNRVKFLDFETLVKRYELVVAQSESEVLL